MAHQQSRPQPLQGGGQRIHGQAQPVHAGIDMQRGCRCAALGPGERGPLGNLLVPGFLEMLNDIWVPQANIGFEQVPGNASAPDLKMKENLGALATIGATAPFVGLFGTVIGIIHAFQKMATSGGGIASVSAGIAEALITTAFGLFVAIPAVWAYNYFQNRIDRFTVEMSNSGSEMAIYFLKEGGTARDKSSVA